MNWYEKLQDWMFAVPENVDDSLAFWREKLLSVMILIGIVFCPITLIPTTMMIFDYGYWSLAVIDLVVLLLCIYFYNYRHTPYRLRAAFILIACYAVGAGIVLKFGLVSGGPAWLFAFSVLAGMMMGVRAAVVAVLLNALTLGPLAYWLGDGAFVFGFLFDGNIKRVVAALGSYVLTDAVASITAAVMVKGVEAVAERHRQTVRSLNHMVDELHQSRRAIEETKERFQTLFQQAPFGIALLNEAGEFVWVNPKFIDMFGYAPEEVPNGRAWFRKAFPDPDLRARVVSAWKEDLATHGIGETRVRVFEVTCKDGSRKTIQFHPVRLHTREDLVVCEDITERLQLEEQLHHARKMEAIGTLAGGIAHDFNNLMQGIVGYAQLMLMEKTENDPDYSRLQGIEKAVDRATHLVRQLMLFGRKAVSQRKLLHLGNEIRQAVEVLERTLPKMVRIECEIDADLLQIEADPTQIEQILLNLGTNAADAMPEGGVLSIAARNIHLLHAKSDHQGELSPGRYILLQVSDTGIGMHPEITQHIFEPFFTTKSIGKGTGLGLASVYGIVTAHGGMIECDSAPGKGTTFRVFFPAVERQPEAVQEKPAAEEIPAGGSEHVLVVDDEADIRDLLGEILPRYGYKVSCAENGEKALELFRNDPHAFDCILLDLSMPGMGGYRCLEEMLRIHPEAIVVIASGYAKDDTVHRALKLGAKDYLEKPYRTDVLLGRIREVLQAVHGPNGVRTRVSGVRGQRPDR